MKLTAAARRTLGTTTASALASRVAPTSRAASSRWGSSCASSLENACCEMDSCLKASTNTTITAVPVSLSGGLLNARM